MNKYVGKHHRPMVHGIWERQLNNIHSYLLMFILVHIYSCSYASISCSYSFTCNLIHTRSYLLLSIPFHIYCCSYLFISLVHTHSYLILFILIHIYSCSYPFISTFIHTHQYLLLFILIHIMFIPIHM